jgi:glycosyltransferase 2 family protein
MVPSTPGYIGVFDAPAKYVLVLSGAADGLATSFTLVLHAALVIPVILLGLVFLWQAGLSLQGLQRQQPKAREMEADTHK